MKNKKAMLIDLIDYCWTVCIDIPELVYKRQAKKTNSHEVST